LCGTQYCLGKGKEAEQEKETLRKDISFKVFKHIQKMSLNEFNRWAIDIYKSGYNDALEDEKKTSALVITNEDMFLMLCDRLGAETARKVIDIVESVQKEQKNEEGNC